MPAITPPKRILIVDDEPGVRALIRRQLTTAGFVVEEAADAQQAIRMQRDNPSHLLIIDILMPAKDGLETIREIREIDHHVPIIAVSAGGVGAAITYLDAAEGFGASACLQKPIDPRELLISIEKLLGQVS